MQKTETVVLWERQIPYRKGDSQHMSNEKQSANGTPAAGEKQPLPPGLRLHWFLSRIWPVIEMFVYAFWIVGFFLMYRGRFNLANGDVFGLGFAVIGLVLSFFIFLFRKELSMREYRLCSAKRLVFLLAGVSAFLFTDYSHYADRFVTAYLLLIGVRFVLRILILVYYLRRRKLFRNGK